ncbi:MAG: hypothetical protein KU37_09620 [Sulfuricurvum sp. PC08-66]|nr:MAG: hypothetical protein KU37_09620 [Sulfuricurvum sp. PC08-66]
MQNECQLCQKSQNLQDIHVTTGSGSFSGNVTVCGECQNAMNDLEKSDEYFRLLEGAIYVPDEATQILSYRLLERLREQGWAAQILESLYIEPEVLAWAKDAPKEGAASAQTTVDAHGTPLQTGDTVTLIKDLEVKGAGFTAKRGTIVKNIRLTDDAKYIEGKINGSTIVLVAAYMKKSV